MITRQVDAKYSMSQLVPSGAAVTRIYEKVEQTYDCGTRETSLRTVLMHEVVSHIGLVVDSSWKRNVQVMSDVWEDQLVATVARDNGSFETIVVLTTGFGQDATVTVDATPEVKAAYEAHLARKNEEARVIREAAALRDAEFARLRVLEDAKRPRRGMRVRVVRGRKIPVGVEGECFWVGNSGFGVRVGLKIQGETFWTDAKNVEAVV